MYSKQQLGYIRNEQRNNFKILINKQNENKKILNTSDILSSKDYKVTKHSNSGDSGELLLANNKKDKNEKYIIKHEYYDCACNEYMYSKIGNEMNIKIAPVKFLKIEDKEKIFKSDFVCAIKYYENSNHTNYNKILEDREKIINWQDYFKFLGMESLFLESDGIEVIQSDNYIYRIDTTAAFSLSHMQIEYLAYDFIHNGINVRDFAERTIMKLANCNKEKILSFWNNSKMFFIKYYGAEYLKYYLEPFYKFADFDENKILEWTRTITYFYPDIIGKYFNIYLKNIKIFANEFITNLL